MLWTIIGLLILFWIAGLVLKIGGAFIHILLVIAFIIFILNTISNRKNTP